MFSLSHFAIFGISFRIGGGGEGEEGEGEGEEGEGGRGRGEVGGRRGLPSFLIKNNQKRWRDGGKVSPILKSFMKISF